MTVEQKPEEINHGPRSEEEIEALAQKGADVYMAAIMSRGPQIGEENLDGKKITQKEIDNIKETVVEAGRRILQDQELELIQGGERPRQE